MSDKPWLAHYDAAVAPTLAPYPNRTLVDYVAEAATLRPDAPAIVFHERTVSWQELETQSAALAGGLKELGIRKGDRVALLLPNTPQSVIAEFAIWKLGAVVLALNPLYGEEELERSLAMAGAVLVITLTRFYERVKAVQPRTEVMSVVVTGIHDYFNPAMRKLYALTMARREGDVVKIEPGDHRFEDLASARPGRLPAPPLPGDTALMLLSGGTTGLPKAVPATHRSLTASGVQLRVWVSSVLEEWNDAVLLPLPLYHVFGVGVQSIAIVGRNPMVLVPNPRDIKGLIKTVMHTRPAFVALVPALLNAMLAHRDVRSGKVDLSFIKGCFSGSAALLQETRKRFEELTRGRIIEGYSLTEALMACTVNPVRCTNKQGSVGMPLPDVEVAIVDETGERVLPVGEAGEVVMRAPQVMTEYWENPEETERTLRRIGEGDPWLFTGDVGYLDPDGYLFLVDRKKDLIKVGGLQVWPREVEEAIAQHPAVAEVAVAGVPDTHKGELVKAWIVSAPGAVVSEGELRAHCRTRLASYKVPVQVEFTTALPRSPLGKVLRRELQKAGMTSH